MFINACFAKINLCFTFAYVKNIVYFCKVRRKLLFTPKIRLIQYDKG